MERCTLVKCPDCNGENTEIDYGPELAGTPDGGVSLNFVYIGFICKDCLHVWAKDYKTRTCRTG